MGGAACTVERFAILKFQAIPTSPADLAQFDTQMRQLYASPTISQSVVNDATDKIESVCGLLAKPTWTLADRTALLAVIESLYPSYT